MFRLIVLSFMMVVLTACTSYFGLSQQEWESLTPSQQAAVVKAYNEREAARQQADNEQKIIAERNAPVNQLIGALGAAIPSQDKQRERTTVTQSCNSEGTSCTTVSKTRSSGWRIAH